MGNASISWRTSVGITAFADTTSPFANVTGGIPSGATNNDLMIYCVGGKPFSTTGSTPTGWTSRASFASGSTAMGNGTGSVRMQVFTRIHSGSESNPAQTFSAQYSPWMTCTLSAYAVAGAEWTTEITTATAETSTVNVTGAATLGFTPGDQVVVFLLHRDDDPATTSPSITIPGCTVGSITQRLSTNVTAVGNDGAIYAYTAAITGGTATGAPQFSATVSNGEGWVCVAFLRVSAQVTVAQMQPVAAPSVVPAISMDHGNVFPVPAGTSVPAPAATPYGVLSTYTNVWTIGMSGTFGIYSGTATPGELCVAAIRVQSPTDVAKTLSLTGWTLIADQTHYFNSVRLRVFARELTDTDDGSAPFSASAAMTISVASYRLPAGWGGLGSDAIAAAATSGVTATPDPPNLDPSWATEERTIWCAFAGIEVPPGAPTGYPSDYFWPAASSNNAVLGAARVLRADAENPGTFGFSDSVEWVAATVAVRGPAETQGQTATPDPVAAPAAVPAPAAAPGAVTAQPPALASPSSVPAPAAAPGAITVEVGAVAAASAVPEPTASSAIAAQPAPVAALSAVPAPAAAAGAVATAPAPVAAAAAVPAPAASSGTAATVSPVPAASAASTPDAVPGSVTAQPSAVPAPSAAAEPAAAPGAISAAPAPVPSASGQSAPEAIPGAVAAQPEPLAAPSAVPPPSVAGEGAVAPSPVPAASAVAAPVAVAGAVVAEPVPVAHAAAVPGPGALAGAVTAQPGALAAPSAVPAPAVSTARTAEPAPVAAESAVPAPVALSSIFVEVGPVLAVSGVPAPSLLLGSITLQPSAAVSAQTVVVPPGAFLGDVIAPNPPVLLAARPAALAMEAAAPDALRARSAGARARHERLLPREGGTE